MSDALSRNQVPGKSRMGRIWLSGRHLLPVLTLLALIFTVFAVTNPVFSLQAIFSCCSRVTAQLWVIAMGMTFVMLAGAVDLSLGAIIAFLAIMFWHAATAGVPVACSGHHHLAGARWRWH
jgi:ribose/xylose/arabinose/galactoside ABC-type transport system permease subunit